MAFLYGSQNSINRLYPSPSVNLELSVTKFDDSNFLLLKSRTTGRGIVIGLGGDNQGCTLALFPFEQGLYALSQSEASSHLRDSIVNEIKGMLPKRTKVELRKQPSDIVTSKTHDFAYEPTRSKFEITRDIWQQTPSYFRYAFAATILALILVSVIFNQQSALGVKVEFSMYLELVEILFVALVIELGGAAWPEVSERIRSRFTQTSSS